MAAKLRADRLRPQAIGRNSVQALKARFSLGRWRLL
jgi:hypothetical protein